jgi:transposase
MLVDIAIKHKCSELVLMRQTEREEIAKEENQKGEPLVLRNWSYYGLKDKIKYKADRVGIKLITL